jgi:hypothetical protein
MSESGGAATHAAGLASCGVKVLLSPPLYYGSMFRIVAIVVVALAAFDLK